MALSGSFEQPKQAWQVHGVTGIISKRQRRYADLGEVHHGNFLADSFDRQYTSHRWVRPNVLQFFHRRFDSPCDSIVIVNGTDSALPLVAVAADDYVVVADQPPHESVTLPIVPSYDPGMVYIKVAAQRADGRRLQVARDVRRKDSDVNGFRISVNHDTIDIQWMEPPKSAVPPSGPMCGAG